MTSQPLAFGLTLPQRGVQFGATTVEEMLDLASTADVSGKFASVWVGDSLLAKPRLDSIGLLGALASVTHRLTLGVGCMASFPVRDPATFAYQWATLDVLSGGRMLLAACTGIVAQDQASMREGAQWGLVDKDRAPRLEENIAICRRLWSESGVTFDGRFTSYDDITVEPKPVQSPCPIWIAANPIPGTKMFERGLTRVAEMADGWMTVQLFPGHAKTSWDFVSEALRERGRDPEAFGRVAYHNVHIGRDRASALEESERFLHQYYGPSFTSEMVAAWTAAGTPDECADHLCALVADGMRHITLRATSWDQRGQYKRLVEEVLPLVRERLGED